ncbi:MAG: phosphoenolpyruvate--protein phosphotransferase [Rhodospirillaceae bacterium]|nr:phosphoenolpyruvate--protein phosphotransferase [Rhodospirillaceae bacterium]MCY4236903.1 phosphoenolpyruvate--protein phosphotransferase [Rhodospirillaceae bacterium]
MREPPAKSDSRSETQRPSASGLSDIRRLLRRIRNVMAGTEATSAQSRLDDIVTLIATNMVAEVCSLYLRRAGEVLELYATEGLNKEAVHKTRLRVGEGVIGDIAARARPIALSDAQSHPGFAYRPETGEEIYHSMMGVPILRNSRVAGVLAVQNRTRRHYTDEEVETLQTVAMVVAEMVNSGQLISKDELREADGNALLPLRLTGLKLHAGIAIGEAMIHREQPRIVDVVAENPAAEQERLKVALASMYDALDVMLSDDRLESGSEGREILETYRLIAEDHGWLGRIREAIEEGLTAEAAVAKIQESTKVRMAAITDPYLRERIADFDDLGNRLLQHLSTSRQVQAPSEPGTADRIVVFARNMGPAELLDYDQANLNGIVLEEGSPTAHVAIIARAMDIPVVGRVAGCLSRVEAGDPVIVDSDNGQVFLRPSENVRMLFENSIRDRAERLARYAALHNMEPISVDGIRISLNQNAGLLVELNDFAAHGVDGVGLYRTEIPFMVRQQFPSVWEQVDFYTRILAATKGAPVVFRTLDIGGDKVLPYLRDLKDENPAMGWRALRIGLDRPAILRQQLRAMIASAADKDLHIMFPMVSDAAEFDAARQLVDKELDRAERKGNLLPRRIDVGVMVEVPALIWQLPELVERADFISIGSNDLLQFLFASDRSNPRLSSRYDPLSPAFMAMIRQIVAHCAAARGARGVPLTVCGEIAGSPLEAMTLIGLGIRRLSMSAASVGPIKAMVKSLDVAALEDFVATLVGCMDHSLRSRLSQHARDHGVVIESH